MFVRDTVSVTNEKKSKRRNQSCKERYARWDKTIAAVVGSLAFLTLIGCLIYDIYSPSYTESLCTEDQNTTKFRSIEYCTTGSSACSVVCSDVPDTINIEEEINAVALFCGSSITLEMRNSALAKNKIPTNWLPNLQKEVNTLNLINVKITDIEDGAFTASTMKRLKKILLAATEIHYLRKDSFEGLSLMDTFEFQFYGKNYLSIEYGFLQHMYDVTTFQLSSCELTSKTIENVTNSDVQLSRLVNMDLSDSSALTLNGNIFSRAPRLASLYLRRMGLMSIDVDVFKGLTSLTRIALENNNLVTLANGIFNNIPKSTFTNVAIHENPWICDCNLEWLKDIYMKNETYISKSPPPVCNKPRTVAFEDIDFCPEITTSSQETTITTEESTTSSEEITITREDTTMTSEDTAATSTETPSTIEMTTSIPTTEEPTTTSTEEPITDTTTSKEQIITTSPPEIEHKYRIISCRDWLRFPITTPSDLERELVNTQEITVNKEVFYFEFFEVGDVPVFIEVHTRTNANITYYHILWFNSHNTSDTGCLSNFDETIILNEMQRNNTYTICVLYGTQSSVSPYDCFGLRVRVEYEERSWIKNKFKTILIGIISSVFIGSILLAVGIMYCCVRFHPALIKGNKRVIIIGKSKTQPQMISASEYDRPSYISPSISSHVSSQSGYITPAYGYSRIRTRYKGNMLGSLHEERSIRSDITYVDPAGPSANQLHSWRMDNLHPRTYFHSVPDSDNSMYEPIPPPLPPPNNTQGRRVEENLYTTV